MAGDELGGDEIHDGIGDFVGAARTPQRCEAAEISLPFRGIAGHRDGTGSDGVDADSRGKFLGEDAGHQDHTAFGKRVRKKFAPTDNAAKIGEIDDDAVAGLCEVGSRGLGAKKRRFEIGVEGGVPSVLGGLAELGFQERGGGVDENIEVAELSKDIGDEFLDCGDVGEFGGKCGAGAAKLFNSRDQFLGFGGGVAVMNSDVRAFLGEAERDSAAEPFGSAGDESDAAMEFGLIGHGKKVAHGEQEFYSLRSGQGCRHYPDGLGWCSGGQDSGATIAADVARNAMKLDLLAMAAHPDDVELTCGGTLLKMTQAGYKTGILDFTEGEMGTRGTREIRAREAAAAAKILKVAWRGNLGVPDSDVQATRQNKLRLASMIRELRPHTVIIPYWEARHPDHYHASALGYEGCFLAGLKQLPISGEPFRPFKILYATSFEGMPASFIVDITKHYETRRKAILAYGSQFRPAKSERKRRVFLAIDELDGRMDLLSRHYGQLIGVKYGEPFLQKELLAVEDVVKLPVRSI